MYPYIFGVIDSYVLFLFIGVIFAFLLLSLYFKFVHKKDKYFILDLLFSGIISVLFGVVFACLFENLYEFALDPTNYKWTFGMTFLGGLFGGVGGFLIMYFFYFKKRNGSAIKELLIISPSCITLAHAFGRIGCFLAGCCYGVETTSIIGVKFPFLDHKVIPTQLIECIFLFLLTLLMLLLAFKFKFKYSFVIYLLSYGIFRFVIEFFRGDERGAFLGIFSPSQVWCIVMILGAIPLYFLLKKLIFKNENNK